MKHGSFTLLPSPGPRRAMLAATCLMAMANAAFAASVGHQTMAARAGMPPARAAVLGSVVAEAGSNRWRGARLAEWLVRQKRWLSAIPHGAVLRDDAAGANCGINQEGPVWFLQSPSPVSTQNCVVPAGKPIFATILAGLNDYPCPDPTFEPAPGQSLEAFLVEFNADIIDTITLAEAVLDDRPLRVLRVRSGIFGFTAVAEPAADACFTGAPQLGQADGYVTLIEPLAPGSHVLRLRGATPLLNGGEPLEVSYLLTVR